MRQELGELMVRIMEEYLRDPQNKAVHCAAELLYYNTHDMQNLGYLTVPRLVLRGIAWDEWGGLERREDSIEQIQNHVKRVMRRTKQEMRRERLTL